MSEAQYTEAQFKKAVEIIQSLPSDGPVKTDQSDQLYVRTAVFFKYNLNPYLSRLQFYSYYKQGVWCKA